MKVVKDFIDRITGQKLHYTIKERTATILWDWACRNKREDLDKYKQYLKKFKIRNFNNQIVVDIGCGAWGGVLRYAKSAKRRIGVDSLINHYIHSGMFDYDGEFLIDDAKRIRLKDNSVDIVFCLNTLDHCDHTDTPRNIIKEIYRILKPKGKTYIYVHLRDDKRLNIMHLYAIEIKDLKRWFSGFHTIKWETTKDFIWNTEHRTFWGIFEK